MQTKCSGRTSSITLQSCYTDKTQQKSIKHYFTKLQYGQNAAEEHQALLYKVAIRTKHSRRTSSITLQSCYTDKTQQKNIKHYFTKLLYGQNTAEEHQALLYKVAIRTKHSRRTSSITLQSCYTDKTQ